MRKGDKIVQGNHDYFNEEFQNIIKNIDEFFLIVNKLKKTKFKYVFYILVCISIIFFLYNISLKIYDDIKTYTKGESFNEVYEYSDIQKKKENNFYKEIFLKYQENENYKKPYIPEGFIYVEGTYDDGFVIEDKNKNQYVWVPCAKKEIENIPKLEKRNFAMPSLISKDSCYDEVYEDFLNSAFENGGFYISRFEIGKENDEPVSKHGIEIWSDLNIDEAKNIINNMYKNENINCEIINGFAYDTTISWLKLNKETEKQVVDVEKEKIIYTGRKSYNRIFDLFDNIMEFSTENFYDNIVVRGVGTVIEDTNHGTGFDEESRYSIFRNDTFVNLYDKLAIRTILYK